MDVGTLNLCINHSALHERLSPTPPHAHPPPCQELLGHCLALYQDNRSSIQRLEAHLGQYGYTAPPGLQVEPENPVAAAAAAAAARRRAGRPPHFGARIAAWLHEFGVTVRITKGCELCWLGCWNAGSDGAYEDEEAGEDVYVATSTRVAVATTASRPTASKSAAAASGKSGRQVVMVTPGVAKSKSGGGTASSRRSATPAGRLGKVSAPPESTTRESLREQCQEATDPGHPACLAVFG